jgi:ribosome-associated protein
LKSGKKMALMLAETAYGGMASDIELLDVRSQCEYADFFLVISAKNKIHVDALKDRFVEFASDNKVRVCGTDGRSESGWVIVDLGDLLIHIFLSNTRDYYSLDSIWGDAKSVPLELSDVKEPAAKTKKPARKKKT